MNTAKLTFICRPVRLNGFSRRRLTVTNVNLKSFTDNQFGYHVSEIELKNNKIPKSFLKFAIDNFQKEIFENDTVKKVGPVREQDERGTNEDFQMRKQLKKLD